jgi:basic membrane protein A
MSKQASQFIAQKADVLTGSSQSVVGAINVARENNAMWFGTQWTQASLAPTSTVATQMYDWMPILKQMFTRLQTGKKAGVTYTITLKNGGEKMQFNKAYKTPKAIKAKAAQIIAKISSGQIRVPVGQ